ncbi:MAG TPA: MarR family transcriptional regulator [Desulfurivibrio alkaliphilus]|uniref:MarR family transcriptional regulator n=1 Tax=Desulfurivibrio alkaliphilus TaxID=427923 RepID=A0A7C2X9V4_9BACT|nr:MarR family transcriptional regulator [Desulfurivibrio alkaliphilus]
MSNSDCLARKEGPTLAPPGLNEQQESRTHKVLTDLRIIFRAIQAYSKGVERQCRVSATMLWALREIAAAGQMRISGVAKALAIHQSTASNLLDKLETRGLVARQRGGQREDQRVVIVALTPAGQELLTQAANLNHGPLAEALQRLSSAQLAELGRGLDQLVAVLPAGNPTLGPPPPITDCAVKTDG